MNDIITGTLFPTVADVTVVVEEKFPVEPEVE